MQYSTKVFFNRNGADKFQNQVMHTASRCPAITIGVHRLDQASVYELGEVALTKLKQVLILYTIKKTFTYPPPYQSVSLNNVVFRKYTQIQQASF